MKIALAGPIDTKALGIALSLDLSALPPGYGYSPLVQLGSGLLDLGHDVHLISLDPTIDAPQTFRFDRLTITYCPVRAAPRYRARVRSLDLFAKEIAFLRAAMRDADCDIVHAHWTYEFAEAALRSGKPSLITMHDLGWQVLFAMRDPYRLARLIMKYRVMARARHVSAVSPLVAGNAWQYGYFGSPDVVPNPIEQAEAPAKSLAAPVIVTVGNDSRLKNVAASVKAFASIRGAFPEAELHLFGHGLGPDGAFGQAGAGIVCHGIVPHDELMAFVQDRATLVVHSSRVETFGLIVGEAKMRGVPVVAGKNSGGVPYVVGEAGGVLVDIERPEEIASAAISILSDPVAYRQMQVTGHQDALARFSVGKVAEAYAAIYRRILNEARA